MKCDESWIEMVVCLVMTSGSSLDTLLPINVVDAKAETNQILITGIWHDHISVQLTAFCCIL